MSLYVEPREREDFVLFPCGTKVYDADRINVFWELFAKEIDDGDTGSAHDSAFRVVRLLKEEFGVMTVGGMKRVQYISFRNLIGDAGGGKGWVNSLEDLLNVKLPRLSASAPASAEHGEDDDDSDDDMPPLEGDDTRSQASSKSHALVDPRIAAMPKNIERFQGPRLGDLLMRTGGTQELKKRVMPAFETFVGPVIKETDKPGPDVCLTANDTSAVMSECFVYMAGQHNYVSGDKLIINHIAGELNKWWRAYKNKSWKDCFRNRLKNGRAKAAQKVPALHAPAPALLPACRYVAPNRGRPACR